MNPHVRSTMSIAGILVAAVSVVPIGAAAANPSPSADPRAPLVDGELWIAYQGMTPDRGHGVHLVRPDGSDAHFPLATHPAASPFATTTLSSSAPPGQSPITPSASPTPAGEGVADPDGRIAFGRTTRYDVDFYGVVAALFAIDPDGSDLVQLTKDDSGYPAWSPDGSRLAFSMRQSDGTWQIATVAADGSHLELLTSGAGVHDTPSWSPDGSWIAYGYSPQVGGSGFRTVLYRIDADGTHPRLLGNPDTFDVQPHVSPDGAKVAFVRLSSNGDEGTLWVRDVATGDETQLKAAGSSVESPKWSPDGRWILYNSGANLTISRIPSDGSGTPVLIVDASMNPRAYKASYSPDGSRILFGCEGAATGDDAICVVNADGSGLTLLIDVTGLHEQYSDWGVAAP